MASDLPRQQDEVRVIDRLAKHFGVSFDRINAVWDMQPRNIRAILKRHEIAAIEQAPERPVCTFGDQKAFMAALATHPWGVALSFLARLYDRAHIELCRALTKDERAIRNFTSTSSISLRDCTVTLQRYHEAVTFDIRIEAIDAGGIFRFVLREVFPISYDNLKEVSSLDDILPCDQRYIGIGGGGGSDIVTAAILGHMLHEDDKSRDMSLLISVRGWNTGSQGKNDQKIGVRRNVTKADGPVTRAVVKANGQERHDKVSGTYRVNEKTRSTGRPLEHVPLTVDTPHHRDIVLVLDQEGCDNVSEDDRVDLVEQMTATLEYDYGGISRLSDPWRVRSHGGRPKILLCVDTGGDVFGADAVRDSTPDQDYRVQNAICTITGQYPKRYQAFTVVVAPAVDAPDGAPVMAQKARGVRYRLKPAEKAMFLELYRRYEMDGSNDERYAKTGYALQARFNGAEGWTSLPLPEWTVMSWTNPWESNVYIHQCLDELIFIETNALLPLITPQGRKV